MLTVDQILNAKFTPVSKGAYSAEDVDAFLKVIAQSYEESLEENNELVKKISILADKIESYRNDEEAIKLSLLDAHRMADSITKNANDFAAEKLSDAETKSKVIVDGANLQSSKMIEEARDKAKEIVDNARTAVASLTARAQAETDQAISAAHKKAAEIVRAAELKGEAIIGNSQSTYEYYSAELDKLKAETKKFKDAVEALCNSELNLVSDFSEDLFASVTAQPYAAKEIEIELPAEEPAVEEAAPVEEIPVQAQAEPVIEAEPEVIEVEEPVAENIEAEEPAAEEPEIIAEPEEAAHVAEEIEVIEEVEEDLFGGIEDFDMPVVSSLDDLVPSLDFDDGFVDFENSTSEGEEGASSDDEDEDITNLFDTLFAD